MLPTVPSPISADPRQRLLWVANSLVGIRETDGSNRSPEIDQFELAVGSKLGDPWCAAFCMYCIQAIEKDLSIKSPIHQGAFVLEVWNQTPREFRLPVPEAGCLVVWNHVGTASGHMGIVECVLGGGWLRTIEGNTGSGDEVVREGDGVYWRKRSIYGTPRMKLLGFLRTFAGKN